MKYAREYYIFFKSFIIFVIYHCIKITPNLQLKTTFMISVSLGQESEHSLAGPQA